MKLKQVCVASAVLATMLTTTACQQAAIPPLPSQAKSTACVSAFQAVVRQGPDAGLTLAGDLTMKIDGTGNVTGAMMAKDGKRIDVLGQTTGRAVNLAFKVADKTFVFGTGSGEQAIADCQGQWGGPFAGPKPGDIGDWIGAFAATSYIAPSGTPPVLNFTCSQGNCTCKGTSDCVDLAQSKICKGKIEIGGPAKTEPDRGDCSY